MTPILDERTLEFISRSHSQTQRIGARLGALLHGGDVICLEGPLGSGKTCLAQGVGRGWGVSRRLISPTFVLVREYTRPDDRVRLYHVDLYRVSDAEEALTLGMEEFVGDRQAICVIEWAERARPIMPHERLWVELGFVGQTRRALRFTAQGERHRALLEELRRSAFGA